MGIGASAGGLQALESFFGSLPPEPGAAFVVVQHLSPDFRSLMVELLQRHTQLPVSVIEDGMVLELNQVYVLPPGMMVSLQGQQLWLEERSGGANDYPIDQFFLSLAQERGDRTIGILLSGTGSDGTEGLKAISRAGGIALVQSQETAQFGAMPSNPISSGLVDEILSPEELAQAVCEIIRYTATQAALTTDAAPLLPDEQLTRILDLLQEQENIDFSQYKIATLHRRIVHRLLLSKASSVEEYLTYLAATPEEVKNLRQDLLIGATRFFRDPEMWSRLQQEVLPRLIESLQPEQPLRLWVAACSTGEEVYSLAIVVHEVMEQLGKPHPVKLFATDIDEEALLIASQGVYPPTIGRDVGAERLDRFLKLEGSSYRIKKFLRAQVVFASHDLTQNPGFSQMHLVSCRNLLIYMQVSLQEQVLKLLHFSLASRGVLVLGPSEHLGATSHAFHTLDQQWKIFRKRQGVQLPMQRSIGSPTLQSVAPARTPKPVRSPYEQLLSEVLKLRFGDRPITCLLVDDTYQLRHIFLNTARLLDFPLGEINTNVLELVVPSLKVPLSTALHRVQRDQQPVLYSDIQVAELSPNQRLNLWVGGVDPKTTDPDAGNQWILLLEVAMLPDSANPEDETEFDPNADLSQHVRELEYELQQTRENLQTSIEELETANEEQQATNEELLASNEELQSTNEELQSVNEELYTVNSENQERIEQLTELTADIDNLLQSTDIGVVFLDQCLNIRKFTPAATEVFNFRMGDTGRPLTELVNHLDLDHITALIQQVAEYQTVQETEATNLKTGDRLLLRILPYRREDGTTDGVVLTLIKVNDLKQVQDALMQSNRLLEGLYRNSPFGLALFDSELRFLRLNQTLADINGLTIAAHIGQTVQELLPDLQATIQPYLQQVLDTHSPVTFEISGTTPAHPGVERTWLASYYPVVLDDEQGGVGAIITDITAQKQIQAELTESQALVQQIAEASPAVLALFELPSGKTAYINSAIENLLGYTPDEIYQDGEEILAHHVHPEDMAVVQAHFAALAQTQTGNVLSYEYRARHKDGSWHWIYQRNVVFRRNADGTVQQVLGVGTDITERVEVQAALQHNETLLRATLLSTPITLWTQDHDLRYTWIHNPTEGLRLENMIGRRDEDFLPAAKATALTQLKQQVLDTGEVCHHEFSLQTGDSPHVFDLTLTPQRDRTGQIVGLTGVAIDITRTKQTETQLQKLTQRLEQAQQIAHIGDWEYDFEQDHITWSTEVFRITGIDPAAGVPSIPELFSLVHPDDRTLLTNLLDQDPDLPQALNVDIRILPKNTSGHRHINIIGRSVADDTGHLTRLYGTVMDVTNRKQAEADLEYRAFFDPLTHIPNRAFFLQHLKLSVSRVSRDTTYQFAVLYLDLDDFKAINDSLGHAAGDQLLIQIARRLDDILRPGDIVSRLGGDEFAILLEKTAYPELALQIAHRVQATIAQPMAIDSAQISTTSSIGIAFYETDNPWHSETAVLENADIAMYQAKRKGPGNIELFHPTLRAQRVDQVELKVGIVQALEQHEFLLYYQPLVDLQRRLVIGFECLVRWQHPQRGLLSPLEFLPVVRSSQLMPGLEGWILKQACRQVHQWQQRFELDTAFCMNVNVSADFLKHASFMDSLRLALSESAVNPQHICLEITEHSFISRSSTVDTVLREVNHLGIKIALDDFGTGYSSLSYLHRLPIDVIKIDQSFIQSLDAEASLTSITRGIVNLAHQLDLNVIAEGIETPRQLEFVTELSCNVGQGYLFSHPVGEQEAERFIQNPHLFNN